MTNFDRIKKDMEELKTPEDLAIWLSYVVSCISCPCFQFCPLLTESKDNVILKVDDKNSCIGILKFYLNSKSIFDESPPLESEGNITN